MKKENSIDNRPDLEESKAMDLTRQYVGPILGNQLHKREGGKDSPKSSHFGTKQGTHLNARAFEGFFSY